MNQLDQGKIAALQPCSPANGDSSDRETASARRESPPAVLTPKQDLEGLFEGIEEYDGLFGTDDCGYRPEVMKLVSALRAAIDHLKWLMAKGIVMSSPSSMTPECLDKIEKILRQ